MNGFMSRFCMAAICTQFVAAGCTRHPQEASYTPPAPANAQAKGSTATAPADSATAQVRSPGATSPVIISPDTQLPSTGGKRPARASIPNPIYHPGTTESLEFTGTYVSDKTSTITGTINFIVAKETSKDRPVNVMNVALEMLMPDGKKRQDQDSSVYGMESDGSLKLLYKESGSERRWVESSTCPKEPREFTEGQASGGEVKFDDGSRAKSTSVVTRDGDYLKVTEITHKTDTKGSEDISETYWYDISTHHIVRYSGLLTQADGTQMTIKGK